MCIGIHCFSSLDLLTKRRWLFTTKHHKYHRHTSLYRQCSLADEHFSFKYLTCCYDQIFYFVSDYNSFFHNPSFFSVWFLANFKFAFKWRGCKRWIFLGYAFNATLSRILCTFHAVISYLMVTITLLCEIFISYFLFISKIFI